MKDILDEGDRMQPLAHRIRPKKFEDVIGQDHLVGPNGVIKKMLNSGNLCSMILYGPAGCGKTSIAYDNLTKEVILSGERQKDRIRSSEARWYLHQSDGKRRQKFEENI